MNKSVIFFGAMVALIVVWLIGFVKSLDEEVDVSYGEKEKLVVAGERDNVDYDASSNEVLALGKLSLKEKELKWKSSVLRTEMLQEFPKFNYMKDFVNIHISDDDEVFKERLLDRIDEVQMDFVASKLNATQAKAAL